jgi:hypothetical protein
LQKIGLLLLLSPFEVHWFLLHLLPKLHLVLIFHVLEVALLVYFVLDLSHNNCHFVGNDAFVLGAGHFSGLVLLIVEVSLLPSLVIAYFRKNCLVLLQIEQTTIDFHKIFSECWLGDESIRDKTLSGLEKTSISHIFFPNAEYLSDGVALKETDIGDDVEKS